MARRSVSTRLRFEIFKRDGFQCFYCGATPLQSPLHIDHVVAVANGGEDDPANLVTACEKCNLGKSSVPLTRRVLKVSLLTEAQHEQPQQIEVYLEHVRQMTKARAAASEAVAAYWREQLYAGLSEIQPALPHLIEEFGIARLLQAIDIVVAKSLPSCLDSIRYFYGVLRQWRRQAATADVPPPAVVERPPEPEPEPVRRSEQVPPSWTPNEHELQQAALRRAAQDLADKRELAAESLIPEPDWDAYTERPDPADTDPADRDPEEVH